MNAVDDLGMAGAGGSDGGPPGQRGAVICTIGAQNTTTQPSQHPDVADPCISTGAATQVYQAWGWPVTVHGEQVCLHLDSDPGMGVDAVAVVLPAGLADEVAEVLAGRRCAPAMLAHPALGSHRVVVAGESFGVRLSWPSGVHRVTGVLLLPPTPTEHGPLRWVRPPTPLALRLCREVDIRSALSTVLHCQPVAESGRGLPLTLPTAALRPGPHSPPRPGEAGVRTPGDTPADPTTASGRTTS